MVRIDQRIGLYLLMNCIFASESCLLLFPFVSSPVFLLKPTFSPLSQFNYKPLLRDQFKVAEEEKRGMNVAKPTGKLVQQIEVGSKPLVRFLNLLSFFFLLFLSYSSGRVVNPSNVWVAVFTATHPSGK